MATLKIGKVVLRSLFKKPATLMYPVVPRQWQERTRGHVGIDEGSCIVCGICAKKCPTNAIAVDRNKRTWGIQRMQCIQCGCCVEACPKACLTMENQYTEPGPEKVVDAFNIPKQEKAGEDKAKGSGSDALACNLEECVYCGLCAKTCPCDALTVDRKEKVWKVDEDACVSCGACVEKCPKKCLSLGGDGKAADDSGEAADDTRADSEPTYSRPEGEDGLRCKLSDCIYCGLCAKTCPCEALEIDRKAKSWKLNEDACVNCGACVNACPKDCLELV